MSTCSSGGMDFSGVTTSVESRSSVSLVDEPSILFDFVAKPGVKFDFEQDSSSNSASSFVESLDESRMQGRPTVGIVPTVPPASVPPHFSDETKSTSRAFFGMGAV